MNNVTDGILLGLSIGLILFMGWYARHAEYTPRTGQHVEGLR